MTVPIRITFHGVPHSQAVEAQARRQAAKLEEFCGRIIRCAVTVARAAHRQHHGTPYQARVDVTVPGETIAIGHQPSNQDLYVAIRDAFEAAERKLHNYARRQRVR